MSILVADLPPLLWLGSAKVDPLVYFPMLVSSISVIIGWGKLIFVLNCKSCTLFLPLVCSIAFGRFFCFSLFKRFRSKARLRRSSSSRSFA